MAMERKKLTGIKGIFQRKPKPPVRPKVEGAKGVKSVFDGPIDPQATISPTSKKGVEGSNE
jgi:hypothetical protein